MPSNQHHHRAGALRQSNKRNKRSKSSKRSLKKAAGGKLAGTSAAGAGGMAAASKTERRHRQDQMRKAKRDEMMKKRRMTTDGPPKMVGIIALAPNEPEQLQERMREFLLSGADTVVRQSQSVSCKYNVHKKTGSVTYVTTAASEPGKQNVVLAALDMARVCDVLLFVVDGNAPRSDHVSQITEIHLDGTSESVSTHDKAQDWQHLVSETGHAIVTAIKAQGLPSAVLTVLAHTINDESTEDYMTMQSVKSLRRSHLKRRLELRKHVGRYALTEFGTNHDKVVEIDLSTPSEEVDDFDENDELDQPAENQQKELSSTLVRTICNLTCAPARWVAELPRPYVVADVHTYDANSKELRLTGFVRGMAPWNVNALVHVPSLGTFACKSIEKTTHPLKTSHWTDMGETSVVYSDPSCRESLEMFATPDALAGEQNLVGFDEEDELDLEDEAAVEQDKPFARPAGWSDYQSAWLDAVDDADAFDADEADHGELARQLNEKAPMSSAVTVATMDIDDANDVTAEEKQALIELRRKEQAEHQQFPDEVQVGDDINARDRFARYRSLKSFRKSPWDPKESLPDSYASIYHFSNFKGTQRAVMRDMKDTVRSAERTSGSFWGATPQMGDNADVAMESEDEDEDLLEGCVPGGSYVTVTLENVPACPSAILLTAVSLLPHENKMSVLHVGLSRSLSLEATPIKSKDVLTFRCGWRTWQARPIFSQHNLNCDKHKFERYMPEAGFFAASIFGPVTYTPCPVLVFNASNQLVASGSMMNADADRIIIKRIILTGYPVKVHKRHAVVKYMFYNPDDVKWFKPAGLYSKHGLQGHIIESVGEHGTMKCLFNAPIKQHDTVCLPLYKRVFPKFVGSENCSNEQKTRKETFSLTVR